MKSIVKAFIRLIIVLVSFFSIPEYFIGSIYNVITYLGEIELGHINYFEITVTILGYVMAWAGNILVPIILWIKSDKISDKIIDDNSVERINITLDFKNFASLTIIIVGLCLSIDTLPGLMYDTAYFIFDDIPYSVREGLKNMDIEFLLKQFVNIIGMIFKIIVSVMIIKYRKKIIDQ